jgi:DNA-binding NtrC family response regulator
MLRTVPASDSPASENQNASNSPPPRTRIVLVYGARWTAEARAALDVLQDLGQTTVASAEEAGAALVSADPDVVVADESAGTAAWRAELLAGLAGPHRVAILLGTNGGSGITPLPEAAGWTRLPGGLQRDALRSMCALALDCVTLRHRLHRLEQENEDFRLIVNARREEPIDDLDAVERYEGIITRSVAMRTVLATLRHIEGTDVTVLLQGETGTGKELVARAVHARSRRRRGPFVAVNLGALSHELRESELFGHVRGAFTGASEARGGLFAAANQGSLFLDEIAEASPQLQVALLRVLEEGVITPVGADQPKTVDVRILSATNQDLGQMVRDGRFRRDLYYRLNVLPIRLPPLRDRPEDIFPLAYHYLERAFRDLGREPTGISRDARVALEAHPWEGNVRELVNTMERAVLLSEGGLIIGDDLRLGSDGSAEPDRREASIELPPGGVPLRELERQIYAKTLGLARGNLSRAARILGLHESTFRFRLRKLGLDKTAAAGS